VHSFIVSEVEFPESLIEAGLPGWKSE
jgi:hypothetical protein